MMLEILTGIKKPKDMDIFINPGTYIVAVSGGVDSMALLHCLGTEHQSPKTRYVVAHYDHGIRDDSADDRKLVQAAALKYKASFVYGEGHLGSSVSEDEARRARYKFLRQAKEAAGASMIITGHHADDELETAVFNLLRGTGRKGLSSLRGSKDILRPMLHLKKQDIIEYAKKNKLTWHEDKTNTNTAYTRNYIRTVLLPSLSSRDVGEFRERLAAAHALNERIDALLVHILHVQPGREKLDRAVFSQFPHAVAKEVLAQWLRVNDIRGFDKKTIERLTVAVKTAPFGSRHDIISGSNVFLPADNTAVIEHKNEKHLKKKR